MSEEQSGPLLRVGPESDAALALNFHHLVRAFPDEPGDPMRDFVVTARGPGVEVEVGVRTWGGDGLDDFLAQLAESFRGWSGVREWCSLERDLAVSAEHTGARVELTWALRAPLPDHEWCFEATTGHAPGEDMRNLAAEMHAFLTAEPWARAGRDEVLPG
ncbi:DUF6228 family protein [Streptomyces longispororuber]|uniref:DUF6228 family protein n=1 Tax=Streptomyces longispororuber TaxID=68230 RepID=UPI002109CA08|nr:DUF6228 family protein [Streptomyces longispororuber]MCQ4212785.1 DUF6228 family protein [Streptomyces longispororuber]